MARYVYRDGEIVEVPKDYTPPRRQGPYIISDTHDAFRSMADGLWYESKSAYRRSLRERGLVELGNDLPREKVFEPANVERDVKDAIEQVRAGKGAKGTDERALSKSIETGKTII